MSATNSGDKETVWRNEFFWGNIDQYYAERIFDRYYSTREFDKKYRPFIIRCSENVCSQHDGNKFTLLVRTQTELKTLKTLKFSIIHFNCQHRQCSIDCYNEDSAWEWIHCRPAVVLLQYHYAVVQYSKLLYSSTTKVIHVKETGFKRRDPKW